MYTNAQLIAICRKAKTHLWNGKTKNCYGGCPFGKEQYTCHALARAATGGIIPPYELKELVNSHIGSHRTMEYFLADKFPRKHISLTRPQIQAWRFLMLDNMIKMLEAKGKKK